VYIKQQQEDWRTRRILENHAKSSGEAAASEAKVQCKKLLLNQLEPAFTIQYLSSSQYPAQVFQQMCSRVRPEKEEGKRVGGKDSSLASLAVWYGSFVDVVSFLLYEETAPIEDYTTL